MSHSWPLEERLCKCGCGMKFRVLPTSTAQYASFWHENPLDTWYEIDGERKIKHGMGEYYREMKTDDEILVEKEELLL